ncbi:hypothetical protein SULI_02755 [Saccharolobus solfataricus]|uniref:Uncharacterized protein n=3 Tax=Saccharolobus solfataricus TaxID=2287 RepID=Q97VA0_SACS2|nr:hypothetical protein [Saccharolobus solfataricus]AAK42845.1 Hypothetical protein SSO11020 [Saccharolobus solfataricus P2]AKA72936.1 hypothetical protein SULB_0539 [Saccharolobus solfataricus]AKA75635.1 hypothetical protein SULC_0537 [Saccharolobus solfataricus]AKA78328.1 hypothetical protein SULA_0537 [Saccharolobus solfataricus]AZF67447.1 hypothetical protein SULG_02755 [Saccharolobus solfataricus]
MDYSAILGTLTKDKRECQSFLSICNNGKFVFVAICDTQTKVYCGEVNENSIIFGEKGNNNSVTYEIPISDNNIKVIKVSDSIYAYNVNESLLSD